MYRPKTGQNRVTCPVTGIVGPSGDFRRRWDGQIVHKTALDPRHPQELYTPQPDTKSPQFSRPFNEAEVISVGIGVWAVGRTFAVTPTAYDRDVDPIGWERWFNTTYTDIIAGV